MNKLDPPREHDTPPGSPPSGRPGHEAETRIMRMAARSLGEATVIESPERPHGSSRDFSATIVVPAAPRLVVTTPRGSVAYHLGRPVVTIGGDRGSDIVVADRAVARRQAELRRVAGGYELVDLHPGSGLTIDGRPATRQRLADGDVIAIGASTLTYRTTPEDPEPSGPPERLTLRGRERVLIGRLAENDVALDHPAVSRFHARIEPREGGYVVEDLDSANGTFVNEERVRSGAARPLRDGDTIHIGPVKLVFGADAIERVDESRSLRLDALGLNHPVGKGVNLIQDISLSIDPREFVAVVGVSGAGKSTLLGALSAVRPAREGAVLVNGADLYRSYDAYRTTLGYVPQDDIIHLDLPVERALDYAAQLRLPPDTSAEERTKRVREVMEELGLSERRDVPVRSLSGGQRKRVSMGVELLTKPGLLFLDEATSGLDPGTELQIMQLLRRLADGGQTVLLVTHATKNVAYCDQVIFLAKGGHLAWFGPPAEALRYFGVADFDEIYEKLEGESTPEEWARRYRESEAYRTYISDRLESRYPPATEGVAARPEAANGAGPADGLAAARSRPAKTGGGRGSALRQLRVLSARSLDILRRDRVSLLLLFLVPVVLGAIDLLAWPRDLLDPATGNADRSMTMLFLGTVITFLIGSLGSVREIVKESAIYRRERLVTLRIVPYLLSKIWLALVLAAYNAAVLIAFKVIAVDMSGPGLTGVLGLYVTLLLASLSGAMFGLLLSAIARREEQVMMLVVLVVVVQIVFSGGILPLRNLGVAGQVLGSATSSKWVFEAQVAALEIKQGDCDGASLQDCRLPGIERLETDAERRVMVRQVDERFRDVFGRNIYTSWAALGAIIAAAFAALVVLQRRKDAT